MGCVEVEMISLRFRVDAWPYDPQGDGGDEEEDTQTVQTCWINGLLQSLPHAHTLVASRTVTAPQRVRSEWREP